MRTQKVFTLLLALVAIATTARAQVVLNEKNFPDANFRAALASKLKISEGDVITAEKIAATTSLFLYWKSIANLKGIEHFTVLTRLDCTYNQLTTLDVSGCTALAELYCNNNQLTSLDVSKNTALTELDCGGNQLTSLDVSKNTALTKLDCGSNQLTLLDVTKNNALEYLHCDFNQLTSLDVSKNTALTALYCYVNQLTALDVSKNTALARLDCFSNQIKGKEMDALVASLPTVESDYFYVINTKDANEGNVCMKSQVAVAKGKGWTVYDCNYDGENWIGEVEYEGSDPSAVESIEVDAEPQNVKWYTIDGVKLNGEPTKKGVYIVNGRKVVK